MRVSVLVPVYGVEKYISECAESLFGQTYKDVEYIFCNDSTKDRSMEILHETINRYPERAKSVRVLSNEKNMGLGASRHRLLQEVRTEAFMIVDSDDTLPADAIATLVECMEREQTDIVEGAYADSFHGSLSEPKKPFHGSQKRYLRALQCQNVIRHRVWGKLYRTEVLSRIDGLFQEGIDYCEDLCATVRLAAVTTRSCTDRVVYHYRTDNISSYTKTVSEKSIRSYFRAQAEILRFYHFRGHIHLSVEIGLLNSFRECHNSKIPLTLADEITRYVPQNTTARLLYPLLRSHGLAFRLGDLLYRIVRLLLTIGR